MELDTEFVHLIMIGNILVGTYKAGIRINLDVAKQIVAARQMFTQDAPLPCLILNGGAIVSMDKPARQYLASEEGTRGLKASAIVLDSPFGSFLGNFFLSVNKTRMPVRIFRKRHAAEKWLQRYVD